MKKMQQKKHSLLWENDVWQNIKVFKFKSKYYSC